MLKFSFKNFFLLILVSIVGFYTTRYLIDLNSGSVQPQTLSLNNINDKVLIDSNGKGIKIGELIKKITKNGFILLMSSTGCESCMDDIHIWNTLNTKHGADYEFIGIIDSSDSTIFTEFLVRGNFSFPVFQIDRQTFTEFNIIQVPSYFVFEKNSSLATLYDKYSISDFKD